MIKIYKVRYIDTLGQEVAEFGFYESRADAMRRWLEVQHLVKMPGQMDIREISVVPDSKKSLNNSASNIYEFKENERKED